MFSELVRGTREADTGYQRGSYMSSGKLITRKSICCLLYHLVLQLWLVETSIFDKMETIPPERAGDNLLADQSYKRSKGLQTTLKY